MKDLFAGIAAALTALAAVAALLIETRFSDAVALAARLHRRGMTAGAAQQKAERRVRRRKLLGLGVPLLFAFAFSLAAIVASDSHAKTDRAAAAKPAAAATGSRCRALLGTPSTAGRTGGAPAPHARARTRRAGGSRRATAAPALVPLGAQGRATAGVVTMRMAFGSDRAPVVRRQTFRLGGLTARDVRVVPVDDIADATGEHALPIAHGQLRTRAMAASGTRSFVELAVCFDPARPAAIRPGSYTGGLMVLAGRAAPVAIGLTITARDDRVWPAILAALIGLLAGIFVRIGADRRWGPIIIDARYVLNFRFWVMVGGGVAAAVYSYLTIYQADPVFDGSVTSLWKLTAQTFAGTLASKAVTDLIGPTAREIRGRKARRQTVAKPEDQLLHEGEG